MPSRRSLLATSGSGVAVGIAGCIGRFRSATVDEPPVEGPCDDDTAGLWPTAGGDFGRTGQAETSPPTADVDLVDVLAGVRLGGRMPLASALPAIANGTAYVPSAGALLAVPLDTPLEGARWTVGLDDDIDAVPVVSCGTVFAAGLNRVGAFDPATGDRRWRAAGGGHHAATIAQRDDLLISAGVDVRGIDVHRGRLRWTAHGGDTLAADDSGIYTTRNDDGSGGIYAHDFDGEERWHLALGKIVGSATVTDGTVWVCDDGGTVYAIDAETGETNWSKPLDGVGKVHSGVAVRGSDLVVPAGVGTTSVVLDAETGAVRHAVGSGIVTGRPVIGRDWFALGRTNEGVTVYDRDDGTPRTTWTRADYELGTVAGLAPVPDGFVIRGGTTSGLSLLR